MSDFRDFVEKVRASTSIVEIIGEDVDLRNAGQVLKGLSPFHEERHPSFVVWPTTQSWYDFSGGGDLGGDVFTYLQQRDNLDFKQALFKLAERAGIPAPHKNEAACQKELQLLAERRNIEQLLTQAAAYYHRILPKRVRDEWYRDHYGFSDDTITNLQLGWADAELWKHFRDELKVDRELALMTGLFIVLKSGKVKDFFQHRLVFPYWQKGQVVYFIARATQYTRNEEWEKAKYKKLLTHTENRTYVSETVQNDHFYNEDAARGAKTLLITEGVTDCISAKQVGIPCISPVTVRFRQKDIERLLQLTQQTDKVVICNDSEESGAGETGALNTAKALFKANRNVHIATIPRPEGKDKIDVNELVATQGKEALVKVLAEARSYLDYRIENIPKNTEGQELKTALQPVLSNIVSLEPLVREHYLKNIANRFNIGKRTLNEQLKLSKQQKEQDGAPRESYLPIICTADRQLNDIVKETARVIAASNQARLKYLCENNRMLDDIPLLFVRGYQIVRLIFDDGPPRIEEISEKFLRAIMSRTAEWCKEIRDETIFRPVFPPFEVAQDLSQFAPKLPRVDSIVTTSVFGKSGTLINKTGYYKADRTWLQLDSKFTVPTVPESPSQDITHQARDFIIDDLFTDFPFATQADRAGTFAALLLPFVRRMISGPTPLHLVEAPSPGTGKSLLCNLIAIIATGANAEARTIPEQEEEMRKMITSELSRARPMVLLDNASERKAINSPALASLLTADIWTDRLLGQNRMLSLTNQSLWMLTANNPRLSHELTRRCIRIRVDPKQDRPWQRKGFKHDPITDWVWENRPQLVHAVLVLIQAWIAQGQPLGDQRLGSFERWAAVMGGILDVAGVKDFLSNLDEFYADADEESELWGEFVEVWWTTFLTARVRILELNELCEKHDMLVGLRGDKGEKSQQSRLGRALMRIRDRVYNNVRIALWSDSGKHRGRMYTLQKVDKEYATDDKYDSNSTDNSQEEHVPNIDLESIDY